MNCKKCGYELQENDAFCTNCGAKVESNSEKKAETEESENIFTNKNTQNSTKKGKLIAVLVAVAALIIAGVALFMPKTVEMEAGELGKIIGTDEIKEYSNDKMAIHGFLLRDGEKTALYSELGEESVVFVYEQGLDEALGDASELIVTGTISKDSSDITLIAENVEVLKATERTLSFKNVATLLSSANDFLNKEIIVTGVVDCSERTNYAIKDENDASREIKLEVALKDQKALQTYGLYKVTGVLTLDGKSLMLKVSNYEIIKELEEKFAFDGVGALLRSAWECQEKKVRVYSKAYMVGYERAILAQADLEIDLYGLTNDQVISIDDKVVTICGTLRGGIGDPYFIQVDEIIFDRAL